MNAAAIPWRELWEKHHLEIGPYASALFSAFEAWAAGQGWPPRAAMIGVMAMQTAIILGTVLLAPLVLVYGERKISAFMQARVGPNQTGPFGLLQTMADGVKLMFKEDIIPLTADRWIHTLAPFVVVVPVFACFAPVPFGRQMTAVDLDAGVLLIFALSGVSTIGIMMAGWGSGNKFSVLGGLRGAAQLVSYEIPRVLSVVPLLMMYGTQNLRLIGEMQQTHIFTYLPKWFIFYPVIGQIAFLIFLISSVAETNRTPFDLPEAESELVAGFHTEYSGLKFALFFLAEYAYMFLAAAMATALFFGGGHGWGSSTGVVPSWLWFMAKTFAIIFLFYWFRWTFPRLRADRLMELCWKFLVPLSLFNIFLTAGWILWRR
jgi:NADH-quinone oxidoreductase subunit H